MTSVHTAREISCNLNILWTVHTMGNIGSQSGHLKYRPASADSFLWPHSLPKDQFQQQKNHLKVLPDNTQNIRLRHTENGEILQTGGTLTGRQLRSEFGEIREIRKSESEQHLNTLMNNRQRERKEYGKERKVKKKYRAPPPPRAESNKSYIDPSEIKKEIDQKARLFKTKIQSDRSRSVVDYHEKSDYFRMHEGVEPKINHDKENFSVASSHRFSWPSVDNAAWDFQGELKEATSRLRKIRSEESDKVGSSEDIFGNISKWDKLKTLDHQIGKEDLIKLRAQGFESTNNKILSPDNPSTEKATLTNYSQKVNKNDKKDTPKQFYFGMSSTHEHITTKNNNSKFHQISKSSSELNQGDYGSDNEVHPESFLRFKKSSELNRFSTDSRWEKPHFTESAANRRSCTKIHDSTDMTEEPVRVFSIFPTGSISNDRSRSEDSGISGDGSPGLYADILNSTDDLQSIIHGWTPQQDLGDDSSFEEGSSTMLEYPEANEEPSNQRHVFSLSLPRDYHMASSCNSNQNETNFDKIKRSISGILNTVHRREADGSLENEKSNWSLNKSSKVLNTDIVEAKYDSEICSELDEFLLRTSKFNTGRLMYLPNFDKPLRQRRYETRYKQKFIQGEDVRDDNEDRKTPVKNSLQDSPVMENRKSIRKKPKRFTFQSTIRQIEKLRIAEKLSREAEKKEQQRLRELELMQNVEKEFQRKRTREKNNIKQQLSMYTAEDCRYDSSTDSKFDGINLTKDMLLTRSEPDGAVSSSPTSSLIPADNKRGKWKSTPNNSTDYLHNDKNLPCTNDCDDNKSKIKIQTQVLSEYRQPQREYKDYLSAKKFLPEGLHSNRQTTIHPKVTYKMLKSKGAPRYASNNYRKDFSCGKTVKTEATWNQYVVKTKSLPNNYCSQYGQLTRF